MKRHHITLMALLLIRFVAIGQTEVCPPRRLTLLSGNHFTRNKEFDLVFVHNKQDTIYITQYDYSGSTFYKGAFEFGTSQKSTAGPNPATNEKIPAKYLNKEYLIHYKIDINNPNDTIISKIETIK